LTCLADTAGAAVYKAKAKSDGAIVAIKEFKDQVADDSGKLSNEITTSHKIQHPYCISYIGSAIEDSVMILVIEFADGGDLFNVIEARKNLNDNEPQVPESLAAKCMSHILAGLEYLHSIFIAHLDVKLENILYCTSNDTYKLADFGISQQFSAETKRDYPDGYFTGVQGTPNYMAPEILRENSKYTESVDIFAFGVTLYMLLTGFVPWQDEDAAESTILYNVDWDILGRKCVSQEAINLIKELMYPNSRTRIEAAVARQHSWLRRNSQ